MYQTTYLFLDIFYPIDTPLHTLVTYNPSPPNNPLWFVVSLRRQRGTGVIGPLIKNDKRRAWAPDVMRTSPGA